MKSISENLEVSHDVGGWRTQRGGSGAVCACVRGAEDLSTRHRLITLIVFRRFKSCLLDDPNNKPLGPNQADDASGVQELWLVSLRNGMFI